MAIEFRPVPLGLSDDSEGVMVFRDGVLMAVMSRLGAHHGPLAGFWNVEAVFAGSDVPLNRHFPDTSAASSFFEQIAV